MGQCLFVWAVCFVSCLTVMQISVFVAQLILVFLFTPATVFFCGSYEFSYHLTIRIGVACI